MTLQVMRSGIHALLSVSMLIGFTMFGAALLLATLSDFVDISAGNVQCGISDARVYKTAPGRAYFTATLYNLGSMPIHEISITFADQNSKIHGLVNYPATILPGETFSMRDSFAASVSEDRNPNITAAAVFDDDSVIQCARWQTQTTGLQW